MPEPKSFDIDPYALMTESGIAADVTALVGRALAHCVKHDRSCSVSLTLTAKRDSDSGKIELRDKIKGKWPVSSSEAHEKMLSSRLLLSVNGEVDGQTRLDFNS